LENVTTVSCLDLPKPGEDLRRRGVRLSLQRSVNGPVKMQDFRHAIAMEQKGKWTGETCSHHGF